MSAPTVARATSSHDDFAADLDTLYQEAIADLERTLHAYTARADEISGSWPSTDHDAPENTLAAPPSPSGTPADTLGEDEKPQQDGDPSGCSLPDPSAADTTAGKAGAPGPGQEFTPGPALEHTQLMPAVADTE